MAFSYLAGTTTQGAADEVVDWFATFEAWITAIGWTVEAGAGSTDMVLRSIGEVGTMTMLYMHVWRDGGNPNHVRIEVQDDLAGTHVTNEAGYLDGAGARFPFWMSGDLDAVAIAFRGGALYHIIYAGMVIPFAATIPDETYCMIATSLQNAGSILRDSGGGWDVDRGLYDNSLMDGANIDSYDASFPICGTYFGMNADIAGQLKHVSGYIGTHPLTVGCPIPSGQPGATSTWIILKDRTERRFALRSSGATLPVGQPDPGTFAAAQGVAPNPAGLWGAIAAFLAPLGWADRGDPGIYDDGRMFSSAGESGVDHIVIGYAVATFGIDTLFPYVADDLAPTHRYPQTSGTYLDFGDFPLPYWLCGDGDCCVLVYQRGAVYHMIWLGLVPSMAPALIPPYPGPPLTDYQLFCGIQQGPVFANRMAGWLRNHAGAWEQNGQFGEEGPSGVNSSPNNFDGVTFILWPFIAQAAAGGQVIGPMRYVGFCSGGGIANLDTITIGAEVFTVFFDGYGNNFCVRTV